MFCAEIWVVFSRITVSLCRCQAEWSSILDPTKAILILLPIRYANLVPARQDEASHLPVGQHLKLALSVPAKLLGIHIDSNLTWKDQYNYICKKISQKIGILKRIRDYVKIYILKMIDNSILLPHIHYGCVIWGRCPNPVSLHIPKGNPRWVVCQTKLNKGGTEDDFLNVSFFHSYQYRPMSQTFAQPTSILHDV